MTFTERPTFADGIEAAAKVCEQLMPRSGATPYKLQRETLENAVMLIRSLAKTEGETNAAEQVPHGVSRADDPNEKATSLPDSSTEGLTRPLAPSATPRTSERGESLSVSDDETGSSIPVPAAPHSSAVEGWASGPDGDMDVLKFVNETPALLSLLYDLDLMPEQCPDHKSREWEQIFIIANHWRENQLAASRAQAG